MHRLKGTVSGDRSHSGAITIASEGGTEYSVASRQLPSGVTDGSSVVFWIDYDADCRAQARVAKVELPSRPSAGSAPPSTRAGHEPRGLPGNVALHRLPPSALADLKELAMPEVWTFPKNPELHLLGEYLEEVFALNRSTGRLATGEQVACFDTGLLDRQYWPIYGSLARQGDALRWVRGVVAGSPEAKQLALQLNSGTLPERANCFKTEESPFDPFKPIHRVAELLRKMAEVAPDARFTAPGNQSMEGGMSRPRDSDIEAAIAASVERAKCGQRAVAPQLHCGRLQFLIPLTLKGAVDLALAVELSGGRYVARALLRPAWAFRCARLIGPIQHSWLRPGTEPQGPSPRALPSGTTPVESKTAVPRAPEPNPSVEPPAANRGSSWIRPFKWRRP